MMRRCAAILWLGLAVMCWQPAAAQVAGCDRLAASPLDTTRPAGVPGVGFDVVDVARAVPRCMQALKERPKDPRIKYQLARALAKSGAPPER
ncbi:hypothetical protein [Enterovirga sp.]|uniref:hypothetical protein n=1 Tax=Enterovirga sp. TaxID=2026350 RepID=UPI002BA1D0D0|nr:hypothetical protein [Enterovirga sp.]HMO28895.1 hypothetical protein [Enterovirga sp.]